MTKTPEWVQTEQERIEKQQAERQTYADTWTPPIGKTKVTIPLNQTVREADTRYGIRKVIKVTVNGKEMDWMINPAGPLWHGGKEGNGLIQFLADGKNTLNIIRAGTGRQTRYSITEAK